MRGGAGEKVSGARGLDGENKIKTRPFRTPNKERLMTGPETGESEGQKTNKKGRKWNGGIRGAYIEKVETGREGGCSALCSSRPGCIIEDEERRVLETGSTERVRTGADII